MSNSFVRPYINLGYGNDRPNGVNSLPELIDFSAKNNTDHVFCLQARNTSEGISWNVITFGRLQRAIEAASGWLVQSSATTGRTRRTNDISPVAVFLNSDTTLFMYLAALIRIGTPVLLLSGRLPPASVAHLLRETRASVVIAGSHLARTAEEARTILSADTHGRDIKIITAPTFFDIEQDQGKRIATPPVFSDYEYSDLSTIVVHTSGTTGLPKPIYHGHIYPLLFATCHRLPPQQELLKPNVSTLPLYHGFGFMAPGLSLSVGLPFVLLPSGTIPTATSTLMALRATGARHVMTVPSILEDIIRDADPETLAMLGQLDFLAVGGAPMKEAVMKEVTRAQIKILNHWGSMETSSVTPIERPWNGYDGHCVALRTDMNLKLVPTEDGSNTLRLIVNPPGWKESYVMPDRLAPSASDRNQYRILGRVDDLLVLANGEKVRPAVLEGEIAGHSSVKGTLAFGAGKHQLGIIVELRKGAVSPSTAIDSVEETLAVIDQLGLDAFIQKANDQVEGHGKIAKDMVVLTREDVKPLKRTEKGSIARKDNYVLFEKEIEGCYGRTNIAIAGPLPMPDVEDGMALKRTIASLVKEVGVQLQGDAPYSADFFEAGMDSLQASRLQNAISGATSEISGKVPSDLIFANPSVDKLYLALSSILTGTHSHTADAAAKEERRLAAMNAMVEKYEHILAGIHDSTVPPKRQSRVPKRAKTVLLTGSTGSLGSYLLARLAKDPAISKVICLNRPSSTSLQTRQMEQMRKRGIDLSGKEWAKVILLDCNLNDDGLSLSPEATALLIDVTHIIHNAWPVTFSLTLSSFEPHFKGVINLMRIALRSARHRGGPPVRFVFISSIAVVGKYSMLNTDGPFRAPECDVGPGLTLELGYAEAKWACEKLVVAAERMFNGSVKGCCVRIGQITGAEGSGIWSEKEHFPIIIRMSRTLKALPLLDGTLAWMLPHRVAGSLVEFMLSQRFLPFYHIENPSRQSWKELMQAMSEVLCKTAQQTQPTLTAFPEWLDQVRRLGNDPENVAFQLIKYFENDFLRLATGGLVLDTSRAVEDSKTMATSTPIERKHFEQYVAYWKAVGAL